MRLTGKGIWGEPSDPATAKKVLQRAVELGVNFIDTADAYGPEVSERLIGEKLANGGFESLLRFRRGILSPAIHGPQQPAFQHQASTGAAEPAGAFPGASAIAAISARPVSSTRSIHARASACPIPPSNCRQTRRRPRSRSAISMLQATCRDRFRSSSIRKRR